MSPQSLLFRAIFRILFAAGTLLCAAAYGQAIITTAAGGGFANNEPALESHLANPQSVAVDASGNIYIAEMNRILLLSHSTGKISQVGVTPFATVKVAPTYLALNSAGNVLFLDSSTLRQLNVQSNAITTIAGKASTNGDTGDNGPASSALLNAPQQFCLDSAGNIYIVELSGYVRRIDAQTGVITTIAGTGSSVFSGDGGPATAATLIRPDGIAVDASGNLYISDAGDFRIRKITATTHIITTIAGTGHSPSGGDGGSALNATFSALGELTIDSHGNLSIIDGDRIRRITAATGIITTVAGNGSAGLIGDGGLATAAELDLPGGLALDSAGDLLIADTGNQRVRMVAAATGIITTIAGTSQNGDGGLAPGAVLNNPMGVAVDAAGDMYISSGTVVRKVSQSTGIITTIAGGGTSTQNGIPALQAQITPVGLAVDSAGNLLIGEAGLIRRVDTSGTITTIAGTGTTGFSGDGGPAANAQVGYVTAIAIDSSGNLFFTDYNNKRVRRIDASTGIITTVIGNGGGVFSGFGQPATATGIGSPAGVAVDSSGNLYIGGLNIYFVLKISPAGVVSSLGGVGGCGYSGDGGLATSAAVCTPSSIALDASGNVLFADTGCYCVRRIEVSTGIIQTVAGTGTAGFIGDGGPAVSAELLSVNAIAITGSTLYIADGKAAVVRGVTPDTPPALPVAPNFSVLVNAASFQTGGIAPGELVTFFGHYLGPVTPVIAPVGSDNKFPPQIPNVDVQVFFDDFPAPLIYVSAGQINAIAPYAIAGGVSSVRIVGPGGSVTSTNVKEIGSSPAIFYNAIVNQDGSINGPAHPAPAGSYVVMYGTGLGQTSPAGVDGEITSLTNYPKQIYSASLTVTQNPLFSPPVPMQLLYAGPAPGEVAGVCQINAVIPDGLTSGLNFLTIASGPGVSESVSIYVE